MTLHHPHLEPEDPHADQDVELLNGLAEVHQKFGLHETALRYLALSQWIVPDSVLTLQLTAQSQFKIGKYKQAINTLEKLKSVNGGSALTEYELLLQVSALALTGDSEKANGILTGSDISNFEP